MFVEVPLALHGSAKYMLEGAFSLNRPHWADSVMEWPCTCVGVDVRVSVCLQDVTSWMSVCLCVSTIGCNF